MDGITYFSAAVTVDIYVHIGYAVFFVNPLEAGQDLLAVLFPESAGTEMIENLMICMGYPVIGGSIGVTDSYDGIIGGFLPENLNSVQFCVKFIRKHTAADVAFQTEAVFLLRGNIRKAPTEPAGEKVGSCSST